LIHQVGRPSFLPQRLLTLTTDGLFGFTPEPMKSVAAGSFGSGEG
jgi:hypothetical protein